MKNRRFVAGAAIALIIMTMSVARWNGLSAQNQNAPTSPISVDSLREWLTYLSSDDLEGRNTFSEGLGLAAAYISERLREAGVRPGGDHGSYFQRVSVLGVRSTNHWSVTVEVNGQTRIFRDGDGISFPRNGVPVATHHARYRAVVDFPSLGGETSNDTPVAGSMSCTTHFNRSASFATKSLMLSSVGIL